MLGDDATFDFGKQNKTERKRLKQKWSFSEIVADLETRSIDGLPTVGIKGLLHLYGMQSHLIHADNKGLDLAIDEENRPPHERKIKLEAHLVRQMSDLVYLWVYCLTSIQHNFSCLEKNAGLTQKLDEFRKHAAPFIARFHRSQDEFYKEVGAR